MRTLLLVHLRPDIASDGERLERLLDGALADIDHETVTEEFSREEIRGRRLLFAVPLGSYGTNSAYSRLIFRLRSEPFLLEGCEAALVVDGNSEFYTKSTAAELVLAANLAGCAFIGSPLVEGTGSLRNLRVQSALSGKDELQVYEDDIRQTVTRLMDPPVIPRKESEILVLHASSRRTSNTMQLWERVKNRLGTACTITEIGLRNGSVSDCSGCPYTMCLHFGEKGRCFYGGMMQEEVWPAVSRCSILVMLCPNYNDALSANLTAFINRLTGLFRRERFYDKQLFSIIVSGYSGGDVIAKQLISALNMNKSFYLPARFAMIETANRPGEVLALEGIEDRIEDFSARIADASHLSCGVPSSEAGEDR